MKNFNENLGGCYRPRPTASTDNTLLDLHDSSYDTCYRRRGRILQAFVRQVISQLLFFNNNLLLLPNSWDIFYQVTERRSDLCLTKFFACTGVLDQLWHLQVTFCYKYQLNNESNRLCLAETSLLPDKRQNKNYFIFIYLFIVFYFISHTIITKNKGKEWKREVARRPNRNYKSLWEVRPLRTTG